MREREKAKGRARETGTYGEGGREREIDPRERERGGTVITVRHICQESQDSQRRPSSNRASGCGSGRGHNSSDRDPDRIPRYGNLATRFYVLLECLPKQALPDDPPRGQFQYTLRWSEKVSIKCDLRGSFQVQHAEEILLRWGGGCC